MSHLTTEQATELVDNGNILLRLIDEVYQFHKFSGILEGEYYECSTPNQVDLKLDETTTREEANTAFIDWFENHEDYKGVAPTIEDTNL